MHSKLVNTYIFHSEKGARVKYEVYNHPTVNFAEVTVYGKPPLLNIISRKVIELVDTPYNHLEEVFKELQRHFDKNIVEFETALNND